jgi:broad specificity phosphatase PhoE
LQVQLNSSIKKIVYFVRHGQSLDNVAPVFQSEHSPLSDTGHKQATFIAKRVSGLPFDKIISSPLTRTRQTAEHIIKATGKPVEYSDLFVERIKPSSCSGKPYTDQQANRTWRAWEESFKLPNKKVEDGENYHQIIKRADSALGFLLSQEAATLLVVTHGYFLRTLTARVVLGNELSIEAFRNFQRVVGMENTGVTVMVYADSFEQSACWRLWVYNDHAHLAV